MCELCQNQLQRTYTHSRQRIHLKHLFELFKAIKNGEKKDHPLYKYYYSI